MSFAGRRKSVAIGITSNTLEKMWGWQNSRDGKEKAKDNSPDSPYYKAKKMELRK